MKQVGLAAFGWVLGMSAAGLSQDINFPIAGRTPFSEEIVNSVCDGTQSTRPYVPDVAYKDMERLYNFIDAWTRVTIHE